MRNPTAQPRVITRDHRHSLFAGDTDFSGDEMGHDCCFEYAQFAGGANFVGAKFGAYANFKNSVFKAEAIFTGASFEGGACFGSARFERSVSFLWMTWGQIAHQKKLHIDDVKRKKESSLAGPDRFMVISFKGCSFGAEVDFSGREFHGTTDFSEAKFSVAPLFYGCKLHQDTTFEGAEFPKPTGNEKAIRAYRTLKLAFSQQQATREEQRFFKLEMEEEALRATGVQKWLYWAYKKFSDFGFSVTQPLKYALCVLGVFTVIYGLLSVLGQCVLAAANCQFSPAWIEFSLLQAIPFFGLDKASDLLRTSVFSDNAYLSVLVTLFVAIHKTISLAAFFLAGLALRNLFKLK